MVGVLGRVYYFINTGIGVNKLIFETGSSLTIKNIKSNINVNVCMRMSQKPLREKMKEKPIVTF